jgi:hypothetical protein
MRKTNLDDWSIIREEPAKSFLTHCIYESDNCEFAFYCSQIEEWSLMKYCTKIKIYKNKSEPKLIYDSKSAWFLFDLFSENDFIRDWTAEKLVCFRQLINKGNNNYSCPYIIINLESLKYVSLSDNSKVMDKEKVNLNEMKWLPLSELSTS